MQETERELGLAPTGNFARSGAALRGLCYYSHALRLPADYGGLRFRYARDGRCPVDTGKDDVFFYRPEAVAGIEVAITPELSVADPARADFVVSHEDFHDQPGMSEMLVDFKEAAAALAGFLVAAEHARFEGQSGEGPLGDVERFLKKAELINRFHQRLTEFYAARRAGEADRTRTLELKRTVFVELERQCQALEPGRAFSRCPGAFNNAALAFDATYTRRYPLLFRLWEATGRNPVRTLEMLRRDLPEALARRGDPQAAVQRLIDDAR